MKHFINIFVGIVLVSTVFTLNCKKAPERFRVGYIPFNADLPFFVALDKGYFKQEGVDVEATRFGNSTLALNAMLSGQIDMVAGLTFSIFFAAEQEAPGRSKFFVPFSETESKIMSYLLLRNGLDISSIKELSGKRIGTYAGATQLLYLKLFLKKNGLDPDKDVTIIQVASNLQVQALMAKQFDALFTVEPYGTIALEKKAGKVFLQNPRSDYIVSPFWSGTAAVRRDFWNKNPTTIKKAYKAMAKAVDYIDTNEIEAKRVLTKFTPMEERIALKSGLYKWYKVDDKIDFQSIQKLADIMYDYELINRRVNVKTMFFTRAELK